MTVYCFFAKNCMCATPPAPTPAVSPNPFFWFFHTVHFWIWGLDGVRDGTLTVLVREFNEGKPLQMVLLPSKAFFLFTRAPERPGVPGALSNK
jgi:hypothetical protein